MLGALFGSGLLSFQLQRNFVAQLNDPPHFSPHCIPPWEYPFWTVDRFWLGVDVRQQGSGNIGMTNVMRVGGKLPGALTFILDFGKAWLAVEIAGLVMLEESSPEPTLGILMLVGLSQFWGMSFQSFAFQGWQISCQIGMLLAVYYPLALVGVGTWLLMFA